MTHQPDRPAHTLARRALRADADLAATLADPYGIDPYYTDRIAAELRAAAADLNADLNGVREEVSRQLDDAEQRDANALIEALRTIHADIVAVQALARADRPDGWTGGAS